MVDGDGECSSWGESLEPAIDFMPLATLIAETSGDVLAVNQAWLDLSGLTEEQSLGGGWTSPLRSSDRDRVKRILGRVAGRGGVETTEQETRTGAGAHWTRWTFRRHFYRGRHLVVMVVVDLDAEHALQGRLRHRATHDALTGLFNRAEFIDMTARAMARAGRVGVIYLDLDRFKQVNDEGGHLLGDRVLAAAAQRLRAAVRPSDAVGRVGGDEFAVLCRSPSDLEGLERTAERLRAVLKAPLEVHGRLWQIAATTGAAVASPGSTAEEMLDRADRAMYAAKFRRRARLPAALQTGGSSTSPDRLRRHRLPAALPPDACPEAAEGLAGHLRSARASLGTCAATMAGGAVEDVWAAIDEVDTALVLLGAAPGPGSPGWLSHRWAGGSRRP